MMDMMNDGAGWGMTGSMWFFSILFWVLVVAGAVLIVKWVMERNKDELSSNESPLDIPKKRYARGEVDRETFERMKKDIEGGNP
mgnify:FL=1